MSVFCGNKLLFCWLITSPAVEKTLSAGTDVPERAPHRRVCCGVSLYIYLVRRAVSHFRLLFCEFLRHSLIQKLLINYSSRRHELLYLLDGNSNDRRPLVDLPIQ